MMADHNKCRLCGGNSTQLILSFSDLRKEGKSHIEKLIESYCDDCIEQIKSNPSLLSNAPYGYVLLDDLERPISPVLWSRTRLPKKVPYTSTVKIWEWQISIDYCDERSIAIKAVHPHFKVSKFEIAGNDFISDQCRASRAIIGTIGESQLIEIADKLRWQILLSRHIESVKAAAA